MLDKNGNGVIDNGRELFGDSTIKSNGQLALDGFDALADLDSNHNGKVDAGDARFGNLKVWRDLNQDGIFQTNELSTLNQLGIASINAVSTDHSQTLANGNQIADLGTFTRIDGSTGTTGEVTGNLATDTFHRQFTTHPDTTAVVSLPDMQACPERSRRGSGAVRNLREATALSPDLAATLRQLGPNTTRAELMAAVKVILQQWADGANFNDSYETAAAIGKILIFVPLGVDPDTAWASTVWDYDYLHETRVQVEHIQRMLKTLEAFNGRIFAPIADDGMGSTVVQVLPGGGKMEIQAHYH